MKYFINKIIEDSFEGAVSRVTGALKEEGFGILTEIDVKETLKKKLDVDFRKYIILGACNPSFAYKALQAERNIGLLLPCNVVVQELPEGEIEISAIDPVSAMQPVGNNELAEVAEEIRNKLERVIESL